MASEMYGMRGRTHSRVNVARTNATRLGFVTDQIDDVDKKLYAWTQVRGPSAIEDSVSWTEVQR